MPHSGVSKVSGLLVVLGLLSIPALAQAQGKSATADKSAPTGQETSVPNKSATKPSEYADAESCKTCHEEIYKGWEKSPHWKQTLKSGGIAKHGCEDCHGAAAAHVADPADTSMRELKNNIGLGGEAIRKLSEIMNSKGTPL